MDQPQNIGYKIFLIKKGYVDGEPALCIFQKATCKKLQTFRKQ